VIPKVIHQIWVGKPIPEVYAGFAKRWQELHPDWEYRLWGDNDFGWLENQDLFDNAEQYVPADAVGQFRSDVARYEILGKYGGLYADCDCEPLRSHDDLMNARLFAGWEVEGQYVANTIIGSVPGHPIWGDMIKAVASSAKSNKGRPATWVSGPRVFTPIIQKHRDATILPTKYFFPYLYSEVTQGRHPEERDYRGSYSVHHWNHRRELRGRPLGISGNGRLSIAIMAHPKRERWVNEYLVPRLPGARVVWDEKNDRWDTGSRSLQAHTDAEWHLVVQDDALLPNDFVAGVQKMLKAVPSGRPVGLYYGRVRPREFETRRLIAESNQKGASFIVHNGPWWGVGIVVPSAHVQSIVEWGNEHTGIPNYDRRISRWYQTEGIDCWYPQPSLIEHRTEDNPSLVPGRTGANRRAYRFVGPQSALQVDWSGPVIRSRQ